MSLTCHPACGQPCLAVRHLPPPTPFLAWCPPPPPFSPPLCSPPLWATQLDPPAVANASTKCADIVPFIGVTSTPVVDPETNVLYVVYKYDTTAADGGSGANDSAVTGPVFDGSNVGFRVAALDVATGLPADLPDAPPGARAALAPTALGRGCGALAGGVLGLDASRHTQRAALVLHKGAVLVTFAGACDIRPYHGWVLAVDKRTLQVGWEGKGRGCQGGPGLPAKRGPGGAGGWQGARASGTGRRCPCHASRMAACSWGRE